MTWVKLDDRYLSLAAEVDQRRWADDSHPHFVEEDLDYWVDFEEAEAQRYDYWFSIDRAIQESEYDAQVQAERERLEQDYEWTTVYRFYDEDWRLLYVGISKQIPMRLRSHNSEKPWWTDACTLTLEHYPTRHEALAAEAAAIVTENPVYNIAGKVRA